MSSIQRSAVFAVPLAEAARMVGVTRAKFYSLYVRSGRVRPITQGQSRVIDVEELRAAYEQMRDESRQG